MTAACTSLLTLSVLEEADKFGRGVSQHGAVDVCRSVLAVAERCPENPVLQLHLLLVAYAWEQRCGAEWLQCSAGADWQLRCTTLAASLLRHPLPPSPTPYSTDPQQLHLLLLDRAAEHARSDSTAWRSLLLPHVADLEEAHRAAGFAPHSLEDHALQMLLQALQ